MQYIKQSLLFLLMLFCLSFLISCSKADKSSSTNTKKPTQTDPLGGIDDLDDLEDYIDNLDPTSAGTPAKKDTYMDTRIALIEEAEKTLSLGNIVFNPPKKMSVGESQKITVRIGDTSIEIKTDDLENTDTIQKDTLKIGDFMIAALSGSHFDIQPLSQEQQRVKTSEVTEWQWIVTPTETGENYLILTLSARLYLSEKDSEYIHKTFDRKISVTVTLEDRFFSFLESYWQWVLSTLILPIYFYIRKKFFAKKYKP